MVQPSFVVFKYQHGDSLVSTAAVWAFWWTLLAVLCVAVWFIGPPGLVAPIALAVVVGWLWPKRCIYLGLRYFVCGHTVAYYKNVRKMALRPGTLTLFWGNQQSFKLEEKLFPTNARKSHKITANKAAKFQKVADKLITRVLAESPSVELVGIDRDKGKAEAPQ